MMMATTPSLSTAAMKRRQRDAQQSPYFTKFRPRRFGEPSIGTPSPGLKETLRKACIDGARRKRQRLVLQKRRLLPQANTLKIEGEMNEDYQSARLVVEEELKRRGVAVHHCFDEEMEAQRAFLDGQGDHIMAEARKIQNEGSVDENSSTDWESLPPRDTCISEDDLFDLMQAVEDEMDRFDDDLFVEQMIEAERREEMHLKCQIEDFEQWEELNSIGSTTDGWVLCPICQTATLRVTNCSSQNIKIACANISCSCRLETRTMVSGNPLEYIRDLLRATFEYHSRTCDCCLQFEVRECHDDGQARRTLVASCAPCGYVVTVL